MKIPLFSLVCLVLCATFCRAQDQPPTKASVEELLTVMNMQKNSEKILDQMPAMVNSMTAQMTPGKDAKSLDAAAKLQTQIFAMMKEEMSWDKMEPLYAQVYQESLTQPEVDGLIAFFKTPVGQSYLDKMPLIMQKTMALTQGQLVPLMGKIQAMAIKNAGSQGQ